ncbi:hypothetical protein PFISCL1PPCAC_25836, partial [Pristionchus fissidentatus]
LLMNLLLLLTLSLLCIVGCAHPINGVTEPCSIENCSGKCINGVCVESEVVKREVQCRASCMGLGCDPVTGANSNS